MYILTSFILLFLLELECQNCGVGYYLKDNGQCDKCHGDCASCHNQNDCENVKKDIILTLTKNFVLFVGMIVENVPIQIGVKNVKMDITYLQGNVTNVTNHAKHVIIQVYVHLA